MGISGENRPAWLRPRHWKEFADAVFGKTGRVLEMLANMAAAMPLKAETTAAAFQATHGRDGVLEKILAVIHQMARKLA